MPGFDDVVSDDEQSQKQKMLQELLAERERRQKQKRLDELLAERERRQSSSGNVKSEGINLDAEEQAGQSSAQSESQQGEDFGEGIKRGVSRGTRSLLRGVDTLLSPVGAPLNYINSMLGGSPTFFNIGENVADAMGLEKPKTDGEKIADEAISGGVGALYGAGLGKLALNYGTKGVTKLLGHFLADAPKTQIAAGAAGMALPEAVEQNGGSTGGQIAASIAGSMAPAAAAAGLGSTRRLAQTLARKADPVLFDKGVDRAAGDMLLDAYAGKPDMTPAEKAAQMRADAAAAPTYVQGAEPTLAQATMDPGLAQAEQALEHTDRGGKIAQKRAEQAAAHEAATREAIENNMNAPLSAEEAGQTLEQVYNQNYDAKRADVRAKYNAVDPNNDIALDATSAYTNMRKGLVPEDERHLPPAVRKELAYFEELATNPKKGRATYIDLQNSRSALSDAERELLNAGKKKAARYATKVKENIDSFLDNEFAARGDTTWQEAKKARREQAADFEEGANRDLSHPGKQMDSKAVNPSSLPSRYFNPNIPENMAAFDSMSKGSQQAKDALSGHAQRLVREKSISPDGKTNSRAVKRFRRQYGPVIDKLPDFGAKLSKLESELSPVEQSELRRLQADRLGRTRGSATARNIGYNNRASEMFGAMPVVGGKLSTLGKIVDLLYPQGKINERMIQAILDPKDPTFSAILDAALQGRKGFRGALRGMNNTESWAREMLKYLTAGASNSLRTGSKQASDNIRKKAQ